MPRRKDTGRDASAKDLAEAKRIAGLPVEVQRDHPSAVAADASKLSHINTYNGGPVSRLPKGAKSQVSEDGSH